MTHQTDTDRQMEYDPPRATEITALVTDGLPCLLDVATTLSLVMRAWSGACSGAVPHSSKLRPAM